MVYNSAPPPHLHTPSHPPPWPLLLPPLPPPPQLRMLIHPSEVVDVWMHGPSSACASIWCIWEWAFELDRNYSNYMSSRFDWRHVGGCEWKMSREQRSIVQMWLIWNRIWIIVFKYLVNLSKKPETIHLNWISPQEFGLTVITFNVKRNI